MNTHDMIISPIDQGFVTQYKKGKISASIVLYKENKIKFIIKNEKSIEYIIPFFIRLSVYQSQFGISVSKNGQYFFVQSWEQGLFCFDFSSGKIQWCVKRRKASKIVVTDDTVICVFDNWGIGQFDIREGKLIKNLRNNTNGAQFLPLNDDLFFCCGYPSNYYLLNRDLLLCRQYSCQEINPRSHSTLIFQDAELVNDSMLLSGIEYSNIDEFISFPSDKQFCFSRIVPIR